MNETELIKREYAEAVEAHGFMQDQKYREMLGLLPGDSLLVDGAKAMKQKLDELLDENAELRSRLEPERQKVYVLVYRSGALKDQIRAMAFESGVEANETADDLNLKPNEYIIIHTSL